MTDEADIKRGSDYMELKKVLYRTVHKAKMIVEGMAGREYEPMTLAELTERSRLNKASVLRILQTLETVGWAEQTPDKTWRLTARFIRMAEDYRLGRDRYFRRLDEMDRNYLGRV